MKKLLFLICAAALTACSDDNGGSSSQKDRIINVGQVTATTWTYISLTTGKVVGTSPVHSEEDDALWATRADWDIALCGTRMRTNSGTSGNGDGGALRVRGVSYENLSAPSAQAFAVDSVYKMKIAK